MNYINKYKEFILCVKVAGKCCFRLCLVIIFHVSFANNMGMNVT